MSFQNADSSFVKACDPLVRVFLWGFVFFFLSALIIEGNWPNLNVQAGNIVSFLIGFCLLWRLAGTRYAYFMNSVISLTVIQTHLKGMMSFKAPHYLRYNPASTTIVMGGKKNRSSCVDAHPKKEGIQS